MKKLSLMLIMILMVFSIASTAIAVPTIVNGTVYSGPDEFSPPVPSVLVEVTCDTATGSDVTSDPEGEYFVALEDGCDIGDYAEACVGDVCNGAIVEDNGLQINIVGVDIFNIPEFNLLTAGVALTGSVLLFIFLRRRK